MGAGKLKKKKMQTIDGRVSLLVSGEGAKLEIYGANASCVILSADFTAEQFCSMLGRVAMVKADLKIYDLSKVGKTHENKVFEFEILDSHANSRNAAILTRIAQRHLDAEGEGWVADSYFSSKDTFFKKDGIQFARVTVRRWI